MFVQVGLHNYCISLSASQRSVLSLVSTEVSVRTRSVNAQLITKVQPANSVSKLTFV